MNRPTHWIAFIGKEARIRHVRVTRCGHVFPHWRDKPDRLIDGNGHKMCHGLEFRYIVKSFVRSYNFRGQNVPWAWEIAPIE